MNSTIISIFSFLIISCATTLPPDKSALDLSPEEAVNYSRDLVKKARQMQADIYSRELYLDGETFSNKAKNCYKKEEFKCALEKAAISINYLSRSISESKKINKLKFQSVLIERQHLITDVIDRDSFIRKRLMEVDENFIETTHHLSKTLSPENQKKILEDYRKLRAELLIHVNLAGIYDSIERSRKLEAKEFAPYLYLSAVNTYERAVKAIKKNSKNRELYINDVYSAKYNSKLLKDVMDVMYREDEPSDESSVIAQVFRERSTMIAEEVKKKKKSGEQEAFSE